MNSIWFEENTEIWCPEDDGVPYLWTSYSMVCLARRTLSSERNILTNTVKIEQNAYGLERVEDGRMLSETGAKGYGVAY